MTILGSANPWSDEVIAEATRLWHMGQSCSQISEALRRKGVSVSRNAVIGKMNRLGVSKGTRQTPAPPSGRRPAAPKVKSEKLRIVNARAIAAKQRVKADAKGGEAFRPGTLPEMAARTSTTEPKAIMDLQRLDCRWPLSEAHQPATFETLYCAAPVKFDGPDALSWCPIHAAMAFNPAPKSRIRVYDPTIVRTTRAA